MQSEGLFGCGAGDGTGPVDVLAEIWFLRCLNENVTRRGVRPRAPRRGPINAGAARSTARAKVSVERSERPIEARRVETPFFGRVVRLARRRPKRHDSSSVHCKLVSDPGTGAHATRALDGIGYVEGVTHDYVRHNTTTLFVALDVANGQVISQSERSTGTRSTWTSCVRSTSTRRQVQSAASISSLSKSFARSRPARASDLLRRLPPDPQSEAGRA